MGFIDSGSKSSRLLASRRYTHNTYTAAQESFTNVLDLRGEEIYTQAQYIPSSGLPYSGSSQHGYTQQASGSDLMTYWYRHKMTKSNVNPEVWFFLNPTGSADGIGGQLIDDNQQVNFISPKYSIASLANSTTEDSTPGYGVVVYKSSTYTQSHQTGSLGSSDKVSGNDYQFDYKTGVLQFVNESVDPASNEVVFITTYQYVGQTLKTGLDIAGPVTASSFKGDGSGLTGLSSSEVSVAFADITGKPSLVSGSGQIADDISGSFNAGFETSGTISGSKDIFVGSLGNTYISGSNGNISASTADLGGNITSKGTISGSAVYGTTIGQNRTDGLKTITIEDTSYINQDLTTDANVTFNQITASGNISASGIIYSEYLYSSGEAEVVDGLTIGGTISNVSTTHVTASGTITGSAVYGTTIGQNTGGGLKTITIEANSTVNQDLTTDATPTFAGINTTGNIVSQGDVIAENYIVSSSVTYMTQSFSSGSNIFGDDISDSHQFTGSINQSGSFTLNSGDMAVTDTLTATNIGAYNLSGKLTAGSTEIEGSNFDINGGTIDGVSNVNSTGTITGSAVYGTTLGQNRVDGVKTITIESNSTINQDVTSDASVTFGTISSGNVTSTGTVSGSAIYGTTIGQNTGGGLKTISIESNSTINQDVTTDASPTFAGATLTGNIKTSGEISGSEALWVGDQSNYISGSTGNLKVSDKLLASKVSGSEFTGSSAIFDTINITSATITGGTVSGITDLAVADGGTGASSFTDGGVLLGSGTGAITAMSALGDGEMIVGDGTTDPVAESGATLRTSIGVGTGDSPQFTDLTLTGDLTVRGDTTTLSTTNLKVKDAFVFAATGSAGSNVDGGLIVQSGSAADSGSAMYHDIQDQRWAVGKGVASDGTAVTPTAYVSTIITANHNPNTDSGSYGSGEMWVNTTDEEVWIRTG